MKRIRVVNVLLVIIALILIFNMYFPLSSLTSNVIYSLDKSEPRCVYIHDHIQSVLSIDVCCPELIKQLTCEYQADQSAVSCYTTKKQQYIVNNKGYHRCRNMGYDVNIG